MPLSEDEAYEGEDLLGRQRKFDFAPAECRQPSERREALISRQHRSVSLHLNLGTGALCVQNEVHRTFSLSKARRVDVKIRSRNIKI